MMGWMVVLIFVDLTPKPTGQSRLPTHSRGGGGHHLNFMFHAGMTQPMQVKVYEDVYNV